MRDRKKGSEAEMWEERRGQGERHRGEKRGISLRLEGQKKGGGNRDKEREKEPRGGRAGHRQRAGFLQDRASESRRLSPLPPLAPPPSRLD